MSIYTSAIMIDLTSRFEELCDLYTAKGLEKMCREMNIDSTGTKNDKAQRIADEELKRAAASTPKPDEDQSLKKLADDLQSTQLERKSIPYKEFVGSFRKFKGDDSQNIHEWLKAFDDMSTDANWSNLENITNLRKSLEDAVLTVVRDLAGLNYESAKEILKKEFGGNCTPARLMRVMIQRKKQKSETVLQYTSEMRRLGMTAGMDDATISQFIVSGLDMNEYVKLTFHGIHDITKLREAIEEAELRINQIPVMYQYAQAQPMQGHMQVGQMQGGRTQGGYVQGGHTQGGLMNAQPQSNRCVNCGIPGHFIGSCPVAHLGRKCFNCGTHGHISAQCPNKVSRALFGLRSNEKLITLNTLPVTAVIDTGSDHNLITTDISDRVGCEVQDGRMAVVGLGKTIMASEGVAIIPSIIDNHKYDVRYNVLPEDAIPGSKCIVGMEFLDTVDFAKGEGTINIKPKKTSSVENENMESEFTRMLRIELSTPEEDIIVPQEYKDLIKELMNKYTPAKSSPTTMTIKLIDETPISQRPRRLAHEEQKIVDEQIRDWLENGIIEESRSPFASPTVVVPKKDGRHRVCIDYRRVNQKIIRDHYPLPLIEDQLDRLAQARVYSTLDMKDSYFHVTIDEDSRKYTGFVTPTGQYQFRVAPFGLCTSGTAFCRMIHEVFRELIAEGIVQIFVDDIIIPSPDTQSGIVALKRVLKAAEEGGLVINWKKCQFLQKRVEYLGYEVEGGKITPCDKKIEKIREYPEPTSRESTRRFYHLTSYFRKFMNNYAGRARPLSAMLKKDSTFVFDEGAKAAFRDLKEELCKPPVLALFDPDAETEVHTDASAVAISGILMQRKKDEKDFHPVYYFSRLTNPAEKNYHSFDLECLATVESVKKFRVYLLGRPFKLVTDCSALKDSLVKKEINARVARWALELEGYQYKPEHRKAEKMQHVDALSRALIASSTEARIEAMQQGDEKIQELIAAASHQPNSEYVTDSGVLYKRNGEQRLLVVPTCIAQALIQDIHNKGHFGVRKMKHEFSKQYYVDDFERRAQQCMKNCIRCLMVERKTGKMEGELRPIPKGEEPLDTWHLDHLGPLASTSKQYEHILTIVDAFAKFTWLFPCKKTTTEETIRKLEVIADVFGYPRRIIADRGTAFTSGAFRKYCEDHGVELHHVATGVPRGNGQVERMHRVIISSLAKLSAEHPEQWYRYVSRVQRYLNGSYQRAINASPGKVMFGVDIRLFGDEQLAEVIDEERRAMFSEQREELRAAARRSIERIQQENRRNYDRTRKPATIYAVGDVVFIKKTQFGVGQKLKSKFLGPYRVSAVLGNDRYGVDKVSADTEGPLHTTTAADLMKRGFCGFDPAGAAGLSGDGRVGAGTSAGHDDDTSDDDDYEDAE